MTEGVTIDVLVAKMKEGRDKRRAEGKRTTEPTEAIFRIPPYDWTADPKGYRVDGELPDGRCYHCASKFVHHHPWDAFCGPCHLAMMMGGEESLLGFQGRKQIASKIRIPDGIDEAVYRKQLEDGSSIEFKTGTQV